MLNQEHNSLTENQLLKSEINQLKTSIKIYEEDLENLRNIITQLKHDKFGSKKEKWIDSAQGLLFNEAELESKKPDDEEDAISATITVHTHERKRGKRKPLPENLPREVIIVELPESERVSENGEPLKVIGKEVSEKLVFEPAKMKIVEYHRYKYGFDSGETIKTAPVVPSIIPKGIATASLLASIIDNKFAYGLPFYRQEEMFAQLGVEIPRNTMARWVVRAYEQCIPILNLLQDKLLSSPYVSCDETHTQVLNETGRRAESKSWMWVRTTPSEKQKIALFDYDPHRSGEVAKRLLSDYKGFLQADAYGAYNPLEKQDGLIRIGCNMHARRRFDEAFKFGAKTGKSLASQALKYYQILYDHEETAKTKSMTWPERFEFRNTECRPVWNEMKVWAAEQALSVPPKSKIGEAFKYFLDEYDYLTGYLLDGRLEADNGFAERVIRKFAIGRNNWLFSSSEDGAHASSLFYSFVITAKLNGVDHFDILKKIFELVPLAKTIDDYERLVNLLLYP